jgi:glycosyltransferase involved in cell wall biosynthesis
MRALNTTALHNVGICRTVFPCPSEAFIVEQAAHLRRFRPTFVVARQTRPAPFEVIAAAEKGDRLREVRYLLTREADLYGLDRLKDLPLLHAHFGPDGVYALPIAERLGVPLVVTFHGFETVASPLALWLSRELPNYQFLLHEGELKRRGALFIAVSEFIRARLIARGYPAERVVRHYIGVDTEKFSPLKGHARDERYVLSVGRHTRRKGIDTLLTAYARIARRHPAVTLVQVGAGPLTPQLTALAEHLGISDRVRFLGAQPHDRVLALMRGAEIFALPSRTSGSGDAEALGIVFNEASACGLPVVATRHGGIPEAVRDGETGLLAPEDDPAALAAHLDALLADRALGERLGRRGREFVLEQFDIRTQTSRLESLYDRFVG